jgi:asparagine synthase (glutamine-hydrolysing)
MYASTESNLMGGIAAAITKHGENAGTQVLTMLQQLEHRGADTIQIATPISTVTAKSIQELKNKKMLSKIAIGQNFSRLTPEKDQTKAVEKEYALAFEGHLFPPSKTSDTEEIQQELKQEPQENAAHIIKKFDGEYTFAILLPNKIIAGRDLLGASPLYMGQNETTYALATERKALWTIGIKHAESFPPGNLTILTSKGFKLKPVAIVTQPNQKTINMEKAAHNLHRLLLKSTMERVSEAEKIAVSFSGGLDSSVIAVLAKKCTKNVNLVTVGLKGQPELRHAETAAKSLEIPIKIQAYTVADVENVLKKVLWLIEEPDIMKVGVAIPFFWAAQIASKTGCYVLLAGQGADELFGGYYKYLNQYAQGDVEAVQKAMFHDLVNSYETNFQRDNPVCAFHRVELRLPFIDREVVRFTLTLPVNLKITSAEDNLRKHVLRRVAQNMSIPTFISDKTKKAVQYTTGVDRAIRELARKKGLTQKDYVKKVFQEIYPAVKE